MSPRRAVEPPSEPAPVVEPLSEPAPPSEPPPATETPAGSTSTEDNIVWSTGPPPPDATSTSAEDNIVWSTGTPDTPDVPGDVAGAGDPPVAIEGVP